MCGTCQKVFASSALGSERKLLHSVVLIQRKKDGRTKM